MTSSGPQAAFTRRAADGDAAAVARFQRRQARRWHADVDRAAAAESAALYDFICWNPGAMSLPYVVVEDPPMQAARRRPLSTEIPHLVFYKDKPEQSGLCLFDPEGREWCCRRPDRGDDGAVDRGMAHLL